MPVDIFHIPLDAIKPEDIQDLLDRAQVETMHLEYKEQLPPTRKEYNSQPKTDKDPFVEFGCDVSAFANAQGGDIIFGIAEAEKTKEPVLVGLPNFDLARSQEHLLHIMNQFVEPRIFGVRFFPITMKTGETLLIVRVPKSLYGPHQVELPRKSFWMRNSSGKDYMDYQAIQNAFTSGVETIERAREWISNQVEKLKHDSPFPMTRTQRQVVHFVPLAFKNAQSSVNLAEIEKRADLLKPATSINQTNHRYNANGYSYVLKPIDQIVPGYTQLFRNGQIEAVSALDIARMNHGRDSLYPRVIETEFLDALERHLLALKLAGATTPILMSVAYLDVKALRMFLPGGGGVVGHDITVNHAQLPDLLITEWPDKNELANITKHFMDCLWQSAGEPGTPYYPWSDKPEQNLKKYLGVD